MSNFKKTLEAIEEFRAGKMIIVSDDKERENEGDFFVAAEKATPEDINFMMKHGRGLICMPIDNTIANRLHLSPMVSTNTSLHETKFTVSVDALSNVTTGISAKDRWQTVQVILDENSKPTDLARPGHLFPLVGEKGGVLRRAGHTEACLDLTRLAGLVPAALLVEIVDEDGSMARPKRLREIAKEHGLSLISIADLIEYRRRHDKLIKEIVTVPLPSKFGDFKIRLFEDMIYRDHHIALIKGDIDINDEVLVRVHSQCITGDIFSSKRCDCGEQLEISLRKIEESKKGVFIYLRQEGRGIGLKNKLFAYQLQDEGLDTVEANHKLGFPADLREYGIGAQILRECNVRRMKLLTNNPKKLVGLEGYNLEIIGRESIETIPTAENKKYLFTKKHKLGHFISSEDAEEREK
ncbi:MAG TPA: bifunctional 3,4-dihydroxy-2-butanone-4-phosphate synthase/GTP cyclohydrolase II [Candidatus Marinimicrobia bacterium]|jgi:3,4-dihydroxy 2-butanone 4-phosphate synthase/GTP cyclohydrolase II|nr:bifunctional 3,4-dihydroxy-2-butanone-4-phosphate synthase/GTP cyclohydrolase II [Candidatus Neomarinimicrobiota bacterium]MEE1506657.1 bifunctional 3,4-dihydroxy-2-butanone-4-phosphate synthase/GTP cyclohydrolase II [Candidatus Neomarinimicrobiota bacterium]MEE1572795.1 bifunctional 3,4-dihydroxy-2-butanone-4-phosphate synthase/GTP cyclohydrolase II [Candidatus Neomarinimicrobiota bacterium]HJL79063.1 bifunctional 3,4-dihydroxy-2-butanone-4-phosphate synthase/GTP cyclohydrolase II [Candidatu|tara:strand:+ start:1813 stop:3039 length:1227 start_codon:yes stop_codon:yes gene_type:complete